jgi:hypothetical protein
MLKQVARGRMCLADRHERDQKGGRLKAGSGPLAARCGEHSQSSEMLVLEVEQGSNGAGAIERALLDHA